MAKKTKNNHQRFRVDEEFELSEFKIEGEFRPHLARFTIYGGAIALSIAASLSFYTGTYVPLSATTGVVVPLMALVIRYYFR